MQSYTHIVCKACQLNSRRSGPEIWTLFNNLYPSVSLVYYMYVGIVKALKLHHISIASYHAHDNHTYVPVATMGVLFLMFTSFNLFCWYGYHMHHDASMNVIISAVQ